MPDVLGVDPGGRNTGIVVRRGQECLAYTVLIRPADDLDTYLRTVLTTLAQYRDEARPPVVVAVEGVNVPNPHVRLSNVGGLLDTAQVLGAIRAVAGMWMSTATIDQLVVVAPARHGSAPLRAYPPVLVGDREGPSGTGRLRHARSAYDVAGTALAMLRMRVR